MKATKSSIDENRLVLEVSISSTELDAAISAAAKSLIKERLASRVREEIAAEVRSNSKEAIGEAIKEVFDSTTRNALVSEVRARLDTKRAARLLNSDSVIQGLAYDVLRDHLLRDLPQLKSQAIQLIGRLIAKKLGVDEDGT